MWCSRQGPDGRPRGDGTPGGTPTDVVLPHTGRPLTCARLVPMTPLTDDDLSAWIVEAARDLAEVAAITGLPASSLVDRRLEELLGCSDWAVLSVGMNGLDEFAEAYGFVARDDVVRAVALMLAAGLSTPAISQSESGAAVVSDSLSPMAVALRAAFARTPEVESFYAARGYETVWSTPEGGLTLAGQALVAAFADAPRHALPADRYSGGVRAALPGADVLDEGG